MLATLFDDLSLQVFAGGEVCCNVIGRSEHKDCSDARRGRLLQQ